MKTLDVESLHTGIDQSVDDIGTVHKQIEAIQRAVRDFQSLDDSLRGEGGRAIRAFYQDTHEPFLVYLHQSLTDYENLLREMKDAIDSFESNASGYVSQEYLESDVKDGFDKVETQAIELTDDANSIIEGVDDIVSLTKIDESGVVEKVRFGKDKAENILEELIILDDYETSQLDQPKANLQTMRTFLTDMQSKFKDGTLSVKSYDVESIKDLTAYQAIVEGVHGEEQTTISAAYGEDIDELPMSEIKKGRDQVLGQLTKSGKQKVNDAYTKLENGEIDRATYANILQEQLAGGIEEGSMDDSFLTNLVSYLDENKGGIGGDVVDKTVQQTGYALLRQRVNEVVEKGIPGPEGKNSFHMIDEKTANRSSKFGKWGQGLKTTSKFLGPALSGVGLYFGYHSDVDDGKTPGQAVSHTGASFLAGVGGAALMGLAFSNPVGWAAVGAAAAIIATGTAASFAFDLAYDNIEWVENSVDWVGDQLDTVGEAVTSAASALNPLNWGRG